MVTQEKIVQVLERSPTWVQITFLTFYVLALLVWIYLWEIAAFCAAFGAGVLVGKLI